MRAPMHSCAELTCARRPTRVEAWPILLWDVAQQATEHHGVAWGLGKQDHSAAGRSRTCGHWDWPRGNRGGWELACKPRTAALHPGNPAGSAPSPPRPPCPAFFTSPLPPPARAQQHLLVQHRPAARNKSIGRPGSQGA
jgi:hypothetical protein